MQKILIIGAGGHAQVVADILMQAHESGEPVLPVGYLDDDVSLHGKELLGLPVLGMIDQRGDFSYDRLIVAIGHNATRKQIIDQLREQGESFVIARHPTATIAPDVSIGDGTMICAGVIVNPGNIIGSGVILNTGCTVDHHNQIGDSSHIAPGVHTGGEVHIGEGTLVGIGAMVLPRCHIGRWSVVGAGSVVTSHIPDYVVAVGVPARVIKERQI